MARSPFTVYFDESGDHGLRNIDTEFPIFVLCAALYRIEDYLRHDCPLFSDIKFKLWWHDTVVFHSYEIRKQSGDFAALANAANRNKFFEEITNFFAQSKVTLIAGAINKQALRDRYVAPQNPYDVSLMFCLERVYGHLISHGGADTTTTCIFEARGAKEDADLKKRFSEICSGNNQWRRALPFQAVFTSKKANLPGLQVADLAAYATARHVQHPNRERMDWSCIEPRFRRGPNGRILGWGLKIFP